MPVCLFVCLSVCLPVSMCVCECMCVSASAGGGLTGIAHCIWNAYMSKETYNCEKRRTYVNIDLRSHMYSPLHLECDYFFLKSHSMINFSRSLSPHSVEKRPTRLSLEIEIE